MPMHRIPEELQSIFSPTTDCVVDELTTSAMTNLMSHINQTNSINELRTAVAFSIALIRYFQVYPDAVLYISCTNIEHDEGEYSDHWLASSGETLSSETVIARIDTDYVVEMASNYLEDEIERDVPFDIAEDWLKFSQSSELYLPPEKRNAFIPLAEYFPFNPSDVRPMDGFSILTPTEFFPFTQLGSHSNMVHLCSYCINSTYGCTVNRHDVTTFLKQFDNYLVNQLSLFKSITSIVKLPNKLFSTLPTILERHDLLLAHQDGNFSDESAPPSSRKRAL